jgi:hypothetical protein
MSNPFEYLSRRSLLKGSLLATLFSSSIGRAFAATPIVSSRVTAIASTQVTVTITASAAVRCYIEYGTSASSLKSKTVISSFAKGESKVINLTGLAENTKVYYRVRYGVLTSKAYSALPIANLTTATKGSTSVFAIQADPHMDENSSADVYSGTLKQIVAAAPLFLMDLGDIFMVDKLQDKSEANIRARFELMKGYYEKLGNVPLKITLGNHDGELGYSKFNTKSYRKEYFPAQTGELAYYSFTTPGALHISLDPFTYTTKNPTKDGWEWTLGKTQYDWLRKTLETSTETHKFIYIHHLLVGDPQSRGGVEIAKLNEWGGNNNDGSYGFDTQRPGWGKPIHQLLLENKVGIVFKGHDHLYVKQELDGIIYQTLPQPSHPGNKIDVTQYGYISGKGVGGSGFLKVTTHSSQATVDFISFDGTVLDSYIRNA